jgi:thioredoxin reductase
MTLDSTEVVIIGAGPAGVAAALQLRRGGIDPLVIERDEVGGLLRSAHFVENYPGFPDGISGPDFVEKLAEHIRAAGITICREEARAITRVEGLYHISTDTRTIPARAVVLATGTVPRELPDAAVPNDARDRVFYEVRRLEGIRGETIAVIGAGDAAFDYALNLASENDVVIVSRNEECRCLPVLRERAKGIIAIKLKKGMAVRALERSDDVLLLRCVSNDGAREETITAGYCLVAIGREPNDGLLGRDARRTDGAGTARIAVSPGAGNGLYMAGDVKNGTFRQTAICVGDGVRVAMEICAARKAAPRDAGTKAVRS